MKIKTHTKIEDPGHGWLKVLKSDLEKLGIADKISSYSFMRGEFAYLEEDGDQSIYIDAITGKDEEKVKEFFAKRKTVFSNKQSKVRGYDSYHVIVPEEALEIQKLKAELLKLRNWNKAGVKKICNASLEDLKYWAEQYGIVSMA